MAAEKAGQGIHADDPRLVVDAIGEVVGKVEAGLKSALSELVD